jgi:Putative zinc-finger
LWKETLKVDCRESRELMSGAVDNELLKGESQGFYQHIEICGNCKDEYELERLTKAYLKRKLTLVGIPHDVEQAILAVLSSQVTRKRKAGFFSRLYSNATFQPVMAVGLVMIIAVALFFANRPNIIMPLMPGQSAGVMQPSGQDVLLVAMNNFQEVLNGTFKPQITAITTSDVSAFLNQNAGYNIPLPSVPSADWVGGSVTKSDGSEITHVVYKIGEGYIYIYSFPKGAMESNVISLPSSCANVIKNDKWYWGMDQNGDTQAVWRTDDHVCVATANLEKKDLVNYLQTSDRTVQ